ncbi:MAG: hypothetical protein ACFB0C_01340 [Leptolyngbyaceae cyanobacterium]
MKKYLISGIPISDSGVGRLMGKIAPEAENRGYTTITLPPFESIKRNLIEKKYSRVIPGIFNRFFGGFIFKIRLAFLRKSIIVFIHPQTSGFENLIKLSQRNKVYLYVMDNSFFCIRSYNTHPDLNTECFRCLGVPGNVLEGCTPYPANISEEKNTKYLKSLISNSSHIVFLAQNEKQKELLKKHFGLHIDCLVVGLDTGEISQRGQDDDPEIRPISESLKFDVVYHGSFHLAKGISYVVEIAIILKEFSFFIPETKEACELALGKPIECENITFMACRWETGLRSAVSQASLVINPSLWSASIEGALLKSIFYGSKVAVVKTEYGFESEIWRHFNLVRLPHNTTVASNMLRSILSAKVEAKDTIQNRVNLTRFLDRKSIFDLVEIHVSESALPS